MTVTSLSIYENEYLQYSFEQLVDAFLSVKDIKPSTMRGYESFFKQLGSYLAEKQIPYVKEKDIKEYKEHLISKGLSIFSVISHLSAIKCLFSFLAARNLYPDIARDIKLPKRPSGFMRDPLTKVQAGKLSRTASGEDIISKRDNAIINVLIRCGLRSIEVIRADVGDIRLSGSTFVLWVHGKGRDAKDEFVVLTSDARKAIQEYLELRPNFKPQEPLFISHGPHSGKDKRLTTRSIRRMVKERLKDIDIDDARITCHSLRHTFATLALANNAPLIAIQKAMRHTNINATITYVHMLDRLDKGAEYFIDI